MDETFETRVAASLTRYNMLRAGDRIGVAVSGGADSVTLLHTLHRFAQYDLTVLHVNHHLRGAESNADEYFVVELGASLGLPVVVEHAPVSGGNLEQLARDGRRAFFFRLRNELQLQAVALGHNQSDQAETVLYRFLRGSGLAGLAGMTPQSPEGLIRPLIHFSRDEIRAWATAQGYEWREDTSNQDPSFIRNRLRLNFFNPQLEHTLAATADIARDEESWWRTHIEPIYKRCVRESIFGLELSVTQVAGLHPAEQRRVLRRAIVQLKGNLRAIDIGHVESLRQLLASEKGHDRVQIPGVDALRSFETMLLAAPGSLAASPRHYRITPQLNTQMDLPHGSGRLYVKSMKPEEWICATFGVEALPAQEFADFDEEVLEANGGIESLVLRNWEPGDNYQRKGHEKAEKIKSLFQEFRVLLWERRCWPVLLAADKIIWSRRFGPAAGFQANDESRSIVRVIYSSTPDSK